MALSLALHGLAIAVLFVIGAAGSSAGDETAIIVELAAAGPATRGAEQTPSGEQAPANEALPASQIRPEQFAFQLAPPSEPPPIETAEMSTVEPPRPAPDRVAIELAPPSEPPPVDASELKPPAPPKPAPQKTETPRAARPSAPPPTASNAPSGGRPTTPSTQSANAGTALDARQAASGFIAAAPIVWEGKARYRHPPTPPVYPPRAVELNQQGEAVVRVRLDAEGGTVEVVLFRGTGFELLDRAALAAVRSWHFLPAVRDGRAVPAWVEIPVRFRLN